VPAGNARGVALPLVLVLLLALTLLGHGILLLSRWQLLASRAYLHAVRGDLAAAGAVTLGLASFPDPSDPRPQGIVIPLASGWTDGGLRRDVTLRWLGPELFLLEGQGRSRGWPGVRRRGAVGWMLDPVTRLGAQRGGVELGGSLILGPGTEASASDLTALPTGWDPADCLPFEPVLDSLYGVRTLPLTAPLSASGAAPSEDEVAIPRLGLLSGPELLARAGDAGFPSPGGAPLSPGFGCPGSDGRRLVKADGDLEIRDARVCGVLVVGGNLYLEGTGSFQGLALVAGDLHLGGGGLLEGMARVGGSVALEDSAILRISGCPAIRALSEASPLLKPLVLVGASRIPLF
jgi:hypothetical protein